MKKPKLIKSKVIKHLKGDIGEFKEQIAEDKGMIKMLKKPKKNV